MDIYNDDEPIVLPPATTRPTVPGRVQLITRNNDKAPHEKNIQKVMLELTGEDKSRTGLDLVVVLDICSYMFEESETEIKTAMLFLIKKLSVVDRLSIVHCPIMKKRLCPLRQMTESTQTELQNLINNLDFNDGLEPIQTIIPYGIADINDGLETALNIFKYRSFSSGRVGAIMLVTHDDSTRVVPVCNVPVHTFGFGDQQNHKFLEDIADNSRLGGTYSYVRMNNLTAAFSQCLGGLLSVVAQDLTVTVRQIEDESTIKQVSAGSYPQSMDNAAGSVTITFGDIYIQEIRKVLVDLHLPSTRKKHDANVLEVSYTYKFNGKLFESSPATVTICRMSGLTAEEQQTLPEVRAEEVRLLISEVIKQATTDAEEEDLKGAQDKLVNGLHKLENADIEMLNANLRPEMEELLKLMQFPAIYAKQVLPFAYSLQISLATQRQMARGNNIGKFQLFATPAMQEFLEEAKKLDNHNPIALPLDISDSGTKKPTVSGRVQLTITNNENAPLEENIQKVLLELSGEENFGLDLVAILDVSSSMEGDKLAKMKIAMLILLKNLNVIDHLWIVEFSSKAKRLCPLLKMTDSSQRKIENLIDDLKPQPGTNITDGLETALNILKDRSLSSGHVGVILLMSDGKQNQGGDAADVPVGNVPVLAFGFGEDHNPEVLITIANNSWMGGTYAEVCMDNLNLTFPQCINELQSVAVWDLTVTVTQIKNESIVKRASAGRYLQSIDNAAGSVTITFGTLYITEVRKVLVDILLPATIKEDEADVLKVSYTYRTSFDGELNKGNSSPVTVRRMSELTAEQKKPMLEVTDVEAHLLIAEVIKQATGVANKEDLLFLRNKLLKCLIEHPDQRGNLVLLERELEYWRDHVEELSELMQRQAINEKQSRSFAYSSLISQFTQRGWARGTYSDVRMNNLTAAFSQCLGGLLSVVAQDLTMTIIQIKGQESTIKQVSAGSYPQSMDNAACSVTITFGDIYIQEIRKVLVDLHLPSTIKKQDADVLEVSYTYKFNGKLFESSPAAVTVCRLSGLTAEEQQALPEVRAKEVRLLIAEEVKLAITKAERKNLNGAQDKLVNGMHKLEDADIEMLKANLRPEMEELLKLMQFPAIYAKQVLPFAYSLLSSLATQRQTARGNNIGKFQLFATPAKQEFLEEAKKLDDINYHNRIVLPPNISDSGTENPTVSGRIKLGITNNYFAPLEENLQKVLLELSCEENSIFGLDLVAVLDVSSSMEGDKLAKMKIAMLLLLKGLRDFDHLSIVEYSSKAKRLCPLLKMTESSKRKIENLIDDLKAQPGTNITDGLETALNILNDCSLSNGRVGVILLMSDGKQNQGDDAADVPVGNVRVLACAFGEDHNPEVLISIANNSLMGGTYAEVCMDNLKLTFPQCINELQSVVVWDLTMTITQIKNESTVKRASAGRYLQSINNAAGSVTITFGTLYIREVRKVLVDILFPVTIKEAEADVLKVSYTYRTSFDGELNEGNSSTVTIRRMSELTTEQRQPRFEITAVEARLVIAEVIKQATGVANNEDLLFFRNKLFDILVIFRINHSTELVMLERELWILRQELEELSELMHSQAINEKQSRSFAYSSLISQFTQRGWARGNDLYKIELFGNPAMREFLEEAKMYDEIDDLQIYIDRFICAMDSIEMIFVLARSSGPPIVP